MTQNDSRTISERGISPSPRFTSCLDVGRFLFRHLRQASAWPLLLAQAGRTCRRPARRPAAAALLPGRRHRRPIGTPAAHCLAGPRANRREAVHRGPRGVSESAASAGPERDPLRGRHHGCTLSARVAYLAGDPAACLERRRPRTANALANATRPASSARRPDFPAKAPPWRRQRRVPFPRPAAGRLSSRRPLEALEKVLPGGTETRPPGQGPAGGHGDAAD